MAKFIEIKKDGEKLIWLAADKADYNAEVTIAEGCKAIVMCDGAIVDNLNPGSHTINIKRMFSKADGKIWSVYGVNSSEPFELLWGCQAMYKDHEYDIVVTLKMCGEIIAKIDNGSKLFRLIEFKEGAITKPMLQDQFRGKLIDEVRNCIAQVTKESKVDCIITEMKSQVANKLRDSLNSYLKEFGLNISDALININSYGELEKIWRLKSEAAESKIQEGIAESNAAVMGAIAKGINAFTSIESEKQTKNKIFEMKK